jgi:Protein of unknown function (DUF3179)
MTWFDHDTGTVWSQPLGQAIVGPLKGATLDVLPSTLTEWGDWKGLHPDTLALDAPGGSTTVSLERMSIVVAFAQDSAAYPFKDLADVVNDVVNDVPIAVVVDPNSVESWTVFSRVLNNGTVVELALTESGTLVDVLTGTTFHIARGTGISGPLSDQVLDLLPAFTSFTKDYFTFYPEGRIWGRR